MMKLAAFGLSVMLPCSPAGVDEVASPAAEEAAEDSMLGMMTMKSGAEMPEADRGYLKAMRTMQKNKMKMEMTGIASADFARMMIPHHQFAIDMVDVLLAEKDIDAEIRTMAEYIREQQAKEIAELQRWLQRHPN